MEFNPALATELLTRFIREETNKAGLASVVLGLSGGIDSALAASLAVRALGPEHVYAVMLPYRTSSRESLRDAESIAAELGMPAFTIDVSAMVDAYFDSANCADESPEAARLRKGNVIARARMIALYDVSSMKRALVLGTSNKTELLLGYGTIYGDMASALNPLGDLYKTEVRQLSRFIGVPDRVIDKTPTADLWPGQSDEDELGFSYEEVDQILTQLVDRRVHPAQLVEMGFRQELVDKVIERIRRQQFKRRTPIIAKISSRTVGVDFRYLRDWGT